MYVQSWDVRRGSVLGVQSNVGGHRSLVAAVLIICLCLVASTRLVSGQSVYIVQPGDTLSAIAGEYGVSISALVELNRISNPDLILIGQAIAIPGGAPPPAPIPDPPAATQPPAPEPPPAPQPANTGGGQPTYSVQSGDTLTAIAQRFSVTVAALVSANSIGNPDLIHIGQVLIIPGAPPAAVVPPPPPAPPAAGTIVSHDEVRAMIYEASAIHREDPYLMMALAWRESNWRQNAVSSSGALGVMQLMPSTANWAGPALVGREIDAANNAWDNIETGIAFYAYLYSLTEDDSMALAGYYQGLYSVRTQGMFPETERYVASILALWPQFAAGELP